MINFFDQVDVPKHGHQHHCDKIIFYDYIVNKYKEKSENL